MDFPFTGAVIERVSALGSAEIASYWDQYVDGIQATYRYGQRLGHAREEVLELCILPKLFKNVFKRSCKVSSIEAASFLVAGTGLSCLQYLGLHHYRSMTLSYSQSAGRQFKNVF